MRLELSKLSYKHVRYLYDETHLWTCTNWYRVWRLPQIILIQVSVILRLCLNRENKDGATWMEKIALDWITGKDHKANVNRLIEVCQDHMAFRKLVFMQPEQLTDLWTMAMKLPNGKPAALSSALDLLASPPPSRSTSKGRLCITWLYSDLLCIARQLAATTPHMPMLVCSCHHPSYIVSCALEQQTSYVYYPILCRVFGKNSLIIDSWTWTPTYSLCTAEEWKEVSK